MKVGDLIKECDYPDLGLLIKIKAPDSGCLTPYGVLCPNGKIEWFTKVYIEEKCETRWSDRIPNETEMQNPIAVIGN